MGIGLGVGVGAGGSAGAGLSASARTFLTGVSQGALIANLSKPFGPSTTFATIGTVPGQLALSGATIVKGASAASDGTSYSIKVRATSGDGKREVAETLVFTATTLVTLGPLTLSVALQSGTAVSGNILGATAGSTIVGNIPGITINSAARTFAGTPTGGDQTIANGLVETHPNTTNSPRSSSVSIAEAGAGPTLAALAGMTFTDPLTRPIEPVVDLGPAPVTGDVLVFEWADNFAMSGSSLIEVTLTDGNQGAGEAVAAALASIPAGVVYATAWYRHGSDASAKLPIIAHGASSPATVTAPPTQSGAERAPMLVSVTSNQPGYLRLTGTDAGFLEIIGAQPGTAWAVRLNGNADTDYEAKTSYAFASVVRNLSGVDSAAAATSYTVTDVDEIVTNPVDFGNLAGVARNSSQTSSIWTVAGLDSGVTVPVTFDKEFRVNGGAWQAPGATIQVGNDDTVQLRLNAAADYLTGVTATGSAGVVALSWSVTTLADPASLIPIVQDWAVSAAALGARDITVNLKAGVNYLWVGMVNKSCTGLSAAGYTFTARDDVFNSGGGVGLFTVTAPADASVAVTVNAGSDIVSTAGICAVSLPGAVEAPAETDRLTGGFYSEPGIIGDGTTRPANGIIFACSADLAAATMAWDNMTLSKAAAFGGWSFSVAYSVVSVQPSFTWGGGIHGNFGLAAAIAKA